MTMREIKFRGKRIDTGEWVYGDLIENQGRYYIYYATSDTTLENEDNSIIVLAEEVDPDTVGQYTGLKDRNGREIYEGDVVRFLDADDKVKNEEVRFGEGGFTPVVEICWMADIEGMFVEVIGNIHDNPELLEED